MGGGFARSRDLEKFEVPWYLTFGILNQRWPVVMPTAVERDGVYRSRCSCEMTPAKLSPKT